MTRSTETFELDPFAFPQETRSRFRMLMAAAVIFTWSLASWVVAIPSLYTLDYDLPVGKQLKYEQLLRERLEAGPNPQNMPQETLVELMDLLGPPLEADRVSGPTAKRFHETLALFFSHLGRTALSIFLVAVLVGSSWLGYRRHPERNRKRHTLRPLESSVAHTQVRELAQIAGIEPPGEVSSKPGFLDGVAFGARGREVLALGGPRQLLERKWNAISRAVALHEMAHIADGDIRTREMSRHLWMVLGGLIALLVLVIAVVSLLSGEARFPLFRADELAFHLDASESPPIGALALKVTAILGVIWWMWTGLVRSREFYADARVAQWGFKRPLLERLRLPEAGRSGRLILRRHPGQAERRHLLEDPEGLFRATPELALLTGLLLAVLAAQMTPFLTDLMPLVVAPSAGCSWR